MNLMIKNNTLITLGICNYPGISLNTYQAASVRVQHPLAEDKCVDQVVGCPTVAPVN